MVEDLAAGPFSLWLSGMQAALRGDADAVVPCGDCTACCTASQFVPIGPDETDTLSHIPPELLFPAPRLPRGHALLGYDERGHCPLLIDGRCSIYEHRPKTCRTYDCRIFAATGLAADEGDSARAAVGRQASRWRFSFTDDSDRRRHSAVQTAVATLRPDAEIAANVTQLAVRAIETHEEFLAG